MVWIMRKLTIVAEAGLLALRERRMRVTMAVGCLDFDHDHIDQ